MSAKDKRQKRAIVKPPSFYEILRNKGPFYVAVKQAFFNEFLHYEYTFTFDEAAQYESSNKRTEEKEEEGRQQKEQKGLQTEQKTAALLGQLEIKSVERDIAVPPSKFILVSYGSRRATINFTRLQDQKLSLEQEISVSCKKMSDGSWLLRGENSDMAACFTMNNGKESLGFLSQFFATHIDVVFRPVMKFASCEYQMHINSVGSVFGMGHILWSTAAAWHPTWDCEKSKRKKLTHQKREQKEEGQEEDDDSDGEEEQEEEDEKEEEKTKPQRKQKEKPNQREESEASDSSGEEDEQDEEGEIEKEEEKEEKKEQQKQEGLKEIPSKEVVKNTPSSTSSSSSSSTALKKSQAQVETSLLKAKSTGRIKSSKIPTSSISVINMDSSAGAIDSIDSFKKKKQKKKNAMSVKESPIAYFSSASSSAPPPPPPPPISSTSSLPIAQTTVPTNLAEKPVSQ